MGMWKPLHRAMIFGVAAVAIVLVYSAVQITLSGTWDRVLSGQGLVSAVVGYVAFALLFSVGSLAGFALVRRTICGAWEAAILGAVAAIPAYWFGLYLFASPYIALFGQRAATGIVERFILALVGSALVCMATAMAGGGGLRRPPSSGSLPLVQTV